MNALSDRFGAAVRHLRAARGWSQEHLADLAGLNRSYLGEIERGVATPSIASAAKLAAAFGWPLSRLVAECEVPVAG